MKEGKSTSSAAAGAAAAEASAASSLAAVAAPAAVDYGDELSSGCDAVPLLTGEY